MNRYKYIDRERFWSKVDVKGPNECWEWKASLGGSGYGQFWTGYTFMRANRVAYYLTHKNLPDDKLILHKRECNNKLCVNPRHLYCGTDCDNKADAVFNECGVYPGRSKFYSGEIWLMKRLRYKIPNTLIAKIFKVNVRTIYKIYALDRYMCKEGYYI